MLLPFIENLTADPTYALKGFELHVADYLLKSFTFERFSQAVERARGLRPTLPEKQFLFIKAQYRLERVLFAELLYIEGARDYRRIHTASRSFKRWPPSASWSSRPASSCGYTSATSWPWTKSSG